MSRFNPRARHRARRYALQALYEWDISHNAVSDIEKAYVLPVHEHNADFPYFQELLHNVPAQLHEIEEAMQPFLDRSQEEMNPVEIAILRIATYELLKRPEIPFRVVINEALELAKVFGAQEGYKYVNGVLDKVAHQLRAAEI